MVQNLVWLNITAQVLNAFLLPLVLGPLVTLAARALPGPVRLRGVYLWVVIGVTTLVSALGLVTAIWGLL